VEQGRANYRCNSHNTPKKRHRASESSIVRLCTRLSPRTSAFARGGARRMDAECVRCVGGSGRVGVRGGAWMCVCVRRKQRTAGLPECVRRCVAVRGGVWRCVVVRGSVWVWRCGGVEPLRAAARSAFGCSGKCRYGSACRSTCRASSAAALTRWSRRLHSGTESIRDHDRIHTHRTRGEPLAFGRAASARVYAPHWASLARARPLSSRARPL